MSRERAANAVPEISIGSAMMTRTSTSNRQPIYERSNEIIALKAQKVQKMKYEQEITKRLQDPESFNPSFMPDTSISQKTVTVENRGDFESFLRDLNVWKNKKEHKEQIKLKERTEREKDVFTHRP